jgi:hypothetical protein
MKRTISRRFNLTGHLEKPDVLERLIGAVSPSQNPR